MNLKHNNLQASFCTCLNIEALTHFILLLIIYVYIFELH